MMMMIIIIQEKAKSERETLYGSIHLLVKTYPQKLEDILLT